MTQNSEKQKQSLTQAEIDPLRQGQRLDAIDKKPKHNSSKTEVTLDAVMLKEEGKRGKLKSQKQSRHSLSKAFSSHKCNSPKMMHSQSPVHNKFFKNQTSLPLVRSLLSSFSKIKQVSPLFDHFSQNSPPCWHMHTSSLKRPKAPPEAETPPE